MRSGKKYYETIAKTFYKKSLKNDLVDEKKVRTVLSILVSEKPAGLSSILKAYKRFVTNKLASEQVVMETNSKTPIQKSIIENLIRKTGAQRVINKINPQIVFGVKVHHGDWVWDDTLDGKLQQIINN